MARLVVDAVSWLGLLVSVPRARSGAAVTGLTTSDFRISHSVGGPFDFRIGSTVPELEV